MTVPRESARDNRRRFLIRLALGAGFVSPIVRTLVAPSHLDAVVQATPLMMNQMVQMAMNPMGMNPMGMNPMGTAMGMGAFNPAPPPWEAPPPGRGRE